jgi:Glycosyl hydrolases family 16
MVPPSTNSAAVPVFLRSSLPAATFLAAIISLLLTGAHARTWTSADGAKTFEGELLSYDPVSGAVSVTMAGGREMKFTRDKLADDYHVYALEWNKDVIKWRVNGPVVHEMKNTHWHQPLHTNFDSETMPDWFGLPDPASLPATFSIDYIRSWSKKEQPK